MARRQPRLDPEETREFFKRVAEALSDRTSPQRVNLWAVGNEARLEAYLAQLGDA